MTPDTSVTVRKHTSAPDRETVPISSLVPADSPRLSGEDRAHVVRLAESEVALPPILVQRHTMRVIDGMHRVRAAILNGREEITVEYFDGCDEDAFVRAVELNIAHGLPLSLADRKAAAMRMLRVRNDLSDRAIASASGLAGKTVAAIRTRATEENAQLHARLGTDGRMRPLDGTDGRRRAAEIISEFPRASLREVAASAGISPGTARDVRRRLERGEDPVRVERAQRRSQGADTRPQGATPSSRPPAASMANGSSATDCKRVILPKLTQDPSVRFTEGGRELLRWLNGHVIEMDDWAAFVAAVPPHRTAAVAALARQSAESWSEFADQLERRFTLRGNVQQ